MASKIDVDDMVSEKQSRFNGQLGVEKPITIDQLLKPNEDNNLVLIQGAGGVGKSYMMETAALHWAQGKIWKDVSFLFLFQFKELNLFANKSFKEAIETVYQTVFSDVKFEDLTKMGDKVLFLMDGIDEFADLNNTLNSSYYCNDTSVASGFYKLIKSQYLPGRKLIVTGRTSSCDQIRSTFKELSIKSFDILGFSSDQVKEYVQTYFSVNETKSQSLLESIEQHEKLELMSRTPAFLWSLCELHQQTEAFIKIETVTQLFAWQITVYLQQHFRFVAPKGSISTTSSMDIFNALDLRIMIKKLSKIAKTSLDKSNVLIDVSEIASQEHTIQSMEKSGFINLVMTSYGEKIQFYHMLMQEFLTAIHFMVTPSLDDQELLDKDIYHGVAPLYAGLKGSCLANSTSPQDLTRFVRNLKICHQQPLRVPRLLSFADRSLAKEDQFLEILFEYQNHLDRPFIGACEEHSNLITMSKAIAYPYSRFFESVPDGHYYNGTIDYGSCAAFPKFYKLAKILEQCDVRTTHNMKEFFENCLQKEIKFRPTSGLGQNIQSFEKAFFAWKRFCTNFCKKLSMFNGFHFSACNRTTNRRRNWIDHYFTKALCNMETLKNADQLFLEMGIPSFNLFFQSLKFCESYDTTKCKLMGLLHELLGVSAFKHDCHWCSQQSFGITKQNCSKQRRAFINVEGLIACIHLNGLIKMYDILEDYARYEKYANRTLTTICSGSINQCVKTLNVKQGQKKYSSSHVVYFFQKFGKIFGHRILSLKLIRSMDIETLKPFLCKIPMLLFFNTHFYDTHSLHSLISHVSNCSDGNIEYILFDYYHKTRDFDYIIANELALKSVFNVKKMVIRVATNPHRAAYLIRRNILNHAHLPLFRLEHVYLILNNLDSRFCVLLQDILPFVQIIEIVPFQGVVFNEVMIEFCKKKFATSVKSLSSMKIKKVIIQGWKLNLENAIIIWEKPDELVSGVEEVSKEHLQNLGLVLVTNFLLSCFGCLLFTAASLYESWFYGDLKNSSFINAKDVDGSKVIKEECLHLFFEFVVFILIFSIILYFHWIPGERFLSYQDPIIPM